jgi:hypothetical protein
MDIRVGGISPVGAPGEKVALPGAAVEARVLAVRAPRRRGGNAPPDGHERRESGDSVDPAAGRVLILLIPDASQLPEGVDQGAWRVFLRFARR